MYSKKELTKRIGDNIRNHRRKKNINQSELARRCFKDRQAMQKIEAGKVNSTMHTLYLIATGLEIELWELFLFEETEKQVNI